MPVEKDTVERSGAANRGDRRAQAADLVEIEQIGADKRSHRAADIGQRRRVFAGEDKGKDCRGHHRRKYRHGDADARHRRGHGMNDKSDRGDSKRWP